MLPMLRRARARLIFRLDARSQGSDPGGEMCQQRIYFRGIASGAGNLVPAVFSKRSKAA